MSAGKGDKRRPQAVSDEQYAQDWDAIFAREKSTAESVDSGINEQITDAQQIRECFEGDEE